MRPIGLIRGLSYESSAGYGPAFERELGGKPGRVDREMVIDLDLGLERTLEAYRAGGWGGVAELALGAARRARRAGAGGLLLAGCTSQVIAPRVEAGQDLPLISLIDAVGRKAGQEGYSAVGLLGSRFTLSHPYFRGRLKDVHGLRVLVPEPADIETLNTCLYQEVARGEATQTSRAEVERICAVLTGLGAQALIPAFAGLEELLKGDLGVPVLDPVPLHAGAGVSFALGEEPGGSRDRSLEF